MKLAVFMLLTLSALVLEVNAAGSYDYGSGGVDPINRKIGFDRGYIYFAVILLGILVILLFMGACIGFVCLYRIHHKRAMAHMWRTKPGTRRLTESVSTPDKQPAETSEANPPPYHPTQIDLPPTYSNDPQNCV